MKTPSSSRPRPVCRLVRQWCAWVENASPRHVAACSDCQAYFAANAGLEAELRRDAGQLARVAPEASDLLESRILRAVRQSTPVAEAARVPAWRGAWAMAAAVAVVAGVGIFYRASGPEEVATQTDVAVLSDAVETVSRGLVDTVIPSAGALVADNPLQREFDSLCGDARAAVGFLALNFLPGTEQAVSPALARPI